MKSFFTILLFISTQTWGQILIKEGKLFYDISYQNLNADVKRNEHLLPHDASFYFKDKKTRMEMGLGGKGKNSTIYDGETKKTTVLLNIFGKKFALIQTDSELVEVKKSLRTDTISKETSVVVVEEYKTIADKRCQKALVYIKTPYDTIINECWFTKELPPYNTENDPNLKSINGFLMQYSITENGMTMVMKVKMIQSIPIEDRMFEIPATYQVVNEEELNLLLGAMSGGSEN
jgi:hypothetical protein